ncbi:hypothetical protein [Novosphingobium album (ex Liu et al. 2023)]|uniref:Uncharacterized protein n=1 Tax=Novosphingobium album (ex Liu et al. 2023) TaxID=3031130 RepID=A0ABT5WKF4_9SPHN|nr:hypothetical protein [Novosphingobium album (ex Liu et al. 2023)]MDE8650528.1 hypothetical protein [Novosphingobium album (ex Liu et al. 2023)]
MQRRAPLLLALAALAVASGAHGQGRPRGGPWGGGRPYANPSAIVAAEIAFNRLAQEKGQWTAFREFAAEDAVMFVPQPVNARGWLKGRANPPASVRWQPGAVWMSCDGSLALSKGAWQRPDGSTGYFTTIWRRNKKDAYEWILDQGDALAQPLDTPDMIAGTVADCDAARRGPPPGGGKVKFAPAAPGPLAPGASGGGASLDGTLSYAYSVGPDNGRTLTVSLRKNGAMEQVLDSRVAPGPAS